MRLLVVENDAREAKRLVAELAAFGHGAMVAADGRAALAMASDGQFDAVLLDRLAPHVGGIEVATRLRERGIDVPIIMLSLLGEVEQRVAGLDAGADDYLVKPAATVEIDARLRAIMRRAAKTTESGLMQVGDIAVNEVKHRATRAGRGLELRRLEFQLLCELVRNANAIVSRETLYRNVWKYDAIPATNIVESYIRRLRAQLNRPGERDPIVTIRGMGYMITDGG
ncbi:MAG: response regulator transcription factor [Sphingomonas sp.]